MDRIVRIHVMGQQDAIHEIARLQIECNLKAAQMNLAQAAAYWFCCSNP
jgi:hypothetical protein